MIISFSLNKQINCADICNSIQKLILDFQQNYSSNTEAAIVINIKPIIDSQDLMRPLTLTHEQVDS